LSTRLTPTGCAFIPTKVLLVTLITVLIVTVGCQ
jgi:hypothetical protein